MKANGIKYHACFCQKHVRSTNAPIDIPSISHPRFRYTTTKSKPETSLQMGWLDNFLPKFDAESSDADRRKKYPEQYPATYELLTPSDIANYNLQDNKEASLIRPLLKNTQLEQRSIYIAFDAINDGWSPEAFHRKVDGKGASIVVAKTSEGKIVGGYNPKGWASMGGARPSVASFLFYGKKEGSTILFQKLRKVGGGGLACANDNPNAGISFGPDALVIPMQSENPTWVQSKLGPYFERGPDNLSSIFSPNYGCNLIDLKVLVGKYASSETIPYSGAVLDMTSG